MLSPSSIAGLISCFDGLSVLMQSGVSAGGISGGSSGEGRFRSSSKYSFHRLSWSAWFVNTCPVLPIICCSSLRCVPASFRVMSYNSFRFLCPVASFAWPASLSTKSFLSRFTLLFTSLSAFVYSRCASVLAALVLLLFIFAYHCFLSATFSKVSAEIHSLCCLVLLPSILSMFLSMLICLFHCCIVFSEVGQELISVC